MAESRAQRFRRVYGGFPRLAWGHGLACIVVGCQTRDCRPMQANVIECAHTRSGGTGRKESACFTVFCCWRHHDYGVKRLHEQHTLNVNGEQYHYTGDLEVNGVPVADCHEGALETERQWQAHEGDLC